MGHPRRVSRPNHPCPTCGHHMYYEFSGKCVHCVRLQAGKTTSALIEKRGDWGNASMDKTPVIDKTKEERIMEGIWYE